jgi:hypothetical protein
VWVREEKHYTRDGEQRDENGKDDDNIRGARPMWKRAEG